MALCTERYVPIGLILEKQFSGTPEEPTYLITQVCQTLDKINEICIVRFC